MSIHKRLSQEDVQVIFDCVRKNKLPPSSLSFKVVRIPLRNSKISPPAANFECGIYVLLRGDRARFTLAPVPSALADLVVTDNELADLGTCHWRSSGLKSHKSNNIADGKYFLRYCYPQNEEEKSASVWTQRSENGDEEDLSVRLLHVYQMQKRSSDSDSDSDRPKKKLSAGIVHASVREEARNYEDIQNLMKEELITTPECTYQETSRVTLSSLRLESGSLFDFNNIDEFLSPQLLASSVVPSPVLTSSNKFASYPAPRISLSPGAYPLISFGRKLDDVSQTILSSKKADQAHMIQMLQQQIDSLTSILDSGSIKSNETN